jgi:phage terminase small subunit
VTSGNVPRPPDALRSSGRAFWRKITSVYDLSPAEVALLARACRTLDTLADIDRTLMREGLVVTGSTGQRRGHPLLGAMSELQRTLEVLIRGMALPMPDEDVGRRRSPQQTEAAQARWRKRREGTGRGTVA